jgi:hypothetical protein
MEKSERLKRNKCKVYFRVVNEETGELIGHLVDITIQGLRVICEKPVHPDAIFHLRLILPVEVEGAREFTLSAMSRWCSQDNVSGFYNAGFEFRNVSLKTTKIIEGVIKSFCSAE